MKKPFLFILLFIGLAISANAQLYTIKGRVIDKTSKSTLAFVNLIVTGHPQLGTTADIDGNFKISATFPITSLSFTYVGYRDLVLPIKDTTAVINITVALQEQAYQLNEVKILPGINPALRIIQAAIDNKDRNNPEKAHSFTYYSYNKLYCTADLKSPTDSINSLDSTHNKKNQPDTTKRGAIYKFFSSQYLFLTESVSQRRFLFPSHNYEEIIASRTSGLKDSPFALLATELQSFSFYPEYISILGDDYLNPISNAGIKRYRYTIEDTLFQGKDSVFVISFHPKKGKNFDGMKGVIYINSNSYAIQNVIAQPIRENSDVGIHIQQKYEYVQNKQWFPVQLNTDMVYEHIVISDSAHDNSKVKIVSRSYIKDIVLDTALRKRDFSRVEVEIAPDASKKTDDFWKKYRNDTLSAKEKKTYHVIDSVGQAIHLDKKLKWFETLATGKLRIGDFDWDLDKVLTYNQYEKFRVGLGVHTNDVISHFVSLGGYGAYGFGDQAFKYGGDVGFLFNPYSEIKLDLAYKNDVIESGGVSFFNDNAQSLLSAENYYSYFVKDMDKIQEERVSFSFDALRYFQFNLFGDEQIRQVTNGYEYGVTEDNATILSNNFQFAELGLGIRFAYGETFMKSPLGMISLGTKYPIVWVNITHGFNDILNGEFDYMKYDLKITKEFHIPQAGHSTITVLAGYVDGNVPYTLLYNARATYIPYSVAAENTFQTMRLNEFASSRYVNLFYYHDFESFLIRAKKFRPHLRLVTNMGWGQMDNLSNHYDFAFKTMDKGYYESGVEINNLIRVNFFSFGIGGYYRYGPYTLSPALDNFVAKFTIQSAF